MPRLAHGLDAFVAKYVTPGGLVDYSAMRRDSGVCAAMRRLLDTDPSSLRTRRERLAFWINGYNVAVLCAMVEDLKRNPRLAANGNGGLVRRLRFFALRRHRIGGRRTSLWALESRIRREFKDPRVHFALVCASNSCPVLKGGLYSAERLDEELDAASRLFVNSPRGAVLDRRAGTLTLSRIFKWYARDFRGHGGAVPFVASFLPREAAEYVRENLGRLRIAYMPYDWGLNASE